MLGVQVFKVPVQCHRGTVGSGVARVHEGSSDPGTLPAAAITFTLPAVHAKMPLTTLPHLESLRIREAGIPSVGPPRLDMLNQLKGGELWMR